MHCAWESEQKVYVLIMWSIESITLARRSELTISLPRTPIFCTVTNKILRSSMARKRVYPTFLTVF